MDITAMDLASPDYIKVLWCLAPWVTAYGVARLFRRRELPPGVSGPLPAMRPASSAEPLPDYLRLVLLADEAEKEKGPSGEGPVKSG
ncbi:hypothetical protein [Gellertiella hungarica]|uniref:Uncharacterized protein n=1 Tax=Gellertiella hungarica TaxID=1572859 RepID=A0A7W6J1N7_9HYPH|nr:hypothetical protein [Gellertiella hungarica]MBB4063139.1 hypothetical protein [Gellertiella hungarica]